MEGDGGCGSGELVHLRRVVELLLGVRGTPGRAKTLKRVPEFPYAHEGVSMDWDVRAAFTVAGSVTSSLL